MTTDSRKHNNKWKILQRLATRSEVVCVQETHDCEDTVHGGEATTVTPSVPLGWAAACGRRPPDPCEALAARERDNHD